MRRPPAALAATLLLLLTSTLALARARARHDEWTATERWAAVRAPKRGPARSIGGYSAGCVQGAEALPPEGPGFEVLHLSRHRYFGHPALVRFVKRLALAAQKHQLPMLLIGDLGQARGGPTPSDHGSHQSGLDVDVSYARPAAAKAQAISRSERDGLKFPVVFDLESRAMTDLWSSDVAELLELAASDPAVDRIFVNAGIKREMCLQRRGAPWIAKLRPWWGHNDHFHVRLHCPADSPECRAQPPVPVGDGCDESLQWWFSDAAIASLRDKRKAPPKPARRWLPGECRAVLP